MLALVTLASSLAAQEPPNFPEPFGTLITPRSVQEEFGSSATPQERLGSPVEAVITAVRLDHYLIITAAVYRLPEGINDVRLYSYGAATVALFGVPNGTKEAPQTPFARTFVRDLNDPGAAAFRKANALDVVQPGDRMQSVPVLELPATSRN
jgi:hypothetical protein